MKFLTKHFKLDSESFSNPKHLYNYFKTLYNRYKENDSEVSMELLINKYEELSEKFENESVKLSKKLDVILKKEDEGTVITSREQEIKELTKVNLMLLELI